MKRRELLKLADGSTLTLVPAVGSWVSAGTVPEVDNMVRIKGPNVTSISVDNTKHAIGCLNKNKCPPKTCEWEFYMPEVAHEDVAKAIDSSNELVDARKLNQNYLKLRKSRW